MKTSYRENCGWQVLRKMRRLIFVLFLPCALSMQYAAALTFNEAAPDDLPATGHRWFADGDSIKASAPGQLADGNKLVWNFHAGYILVMGMSNRADPDKSPQLFFDRGPQIFLERGMGPHMAVRIERQF